MKVYTRVVMDMSSMEILEEDSFEYEGPVAEAKKDAPAPDYTPMANATAETAAISKELGEKQLAENQRQFEETKKISQPVIDAQLELMKQTKAQGDDYYNYMVSKQRPVEDALNNESLRDTTVDDARLREGMFLQAMQNADNASGRAGAASGRAQALQGMTNAFMGANNADVATYTGGNAAIDARYGRDINEAVDRAVADAREGSTQATNQAIRQALRYGLSVPDTTGQVTLADAKNRAAAANTTRLSEREKLRQILGQGISMRTDTFNSGSNATANANNQAMAADTAANAADQIRLGGYASDRDLYYQDKARDWAKKLDVAGLYRGLAGASQGAYSLANNSGNSAVANQNATTGQYLSGMNAGTNTIMNGRQMVQSGLGNILSSQTSMAANAGGEGIGSTLGGIGALAGGLAKAAPVFGF